LHEQEFQSIFIQWCQANHDEIFGGIFYALHNNFACKYVGCSMRMLFSPVHFCHGSSVLCVAFIPELMAECQLLSGTTCS